MSGPNIPNIGYWMSRTDTIGCRRIPNVCGLGKGWTGKGGTWKGGTGKSVTGKVETGKDGQGRLEQGRP